MDVNPSIIPVRIATCLSYPVKVEDERFLWIHVDWSHVPGAYDDDDDDDDADDDDADDDVDDRHAAADDDGDDDDDDDADEER